MRIAICINESALGGVGTSTYILCKGMRKAGHEADILATASGAGDDYVRARREGWPVEAICVDERWLRRRLEIVLERLSPYDVVINNHSIETQLILPALPPTIVRLSVIRSTDKPVIDESVLNRASLDALVGISPKVTELLKASGNECPVRTIPNAVLLRNETLPSLSSPVRIVYTGRLEERQKNILILPEIAEVLVKRGLQFQLAVVGDGPHRCDLEEKVRQFGMGRFIKILGSLEREKAWDVFRESHFALIPSNFEGFGLVVVEAMAAGCVPIVSDIPVFRWILGADAAMLTAPVRNAQAYADRLCAIAADSELYMRLQIGLRRRQRENFTPEATVNKYLSLLEDLRNGRDEDRFAPVRVVELDLPTYYKRRFTWAWRLLQMCRYGIRGRMT